MQFIETRGNESGFLEKVNFSEAILSPIASFGGLYVPEHFPTLDSDFLNEYKNRSYKELAFALLKKFEIDIDDTDLLTALDRYDAYDDTNNPVPLSKIEEDLYVCELWHGPTRAFKDMALQPFGSVLSALAKRKEENYLILAATSGDTGPAALATFADQPFIKVACLYPNGGTSDVQRLQMTTMEGENLNVIGINGSFDDAQNSLKNMLGSNDFKAELEKKNIKLSAANSVNFGRIIFQIIYHVHSYLELLRTQAISEGEKIYMVIPSGNFGNALGAYYAQKMGIPIEKMLISSNENNVLTDLINTGKYDLRTKKLVNTTSPAMDILKSSNIERVLYDLFGAQRTKELMQDLADNNCYELTKEELSTLRGFFDATFSNDEECAQGIKKYADNSYIMDTHTATCLKSYETSRDKKLKTVIYSTAEWTKFSPVVNDAVNPSSSDLLHDKEALDAISTKFNIPVPEMIHALFEKKERFTNIINKEDIQKEIISFL